MKAIQVKFLGATNSLGPRLKAFTEGGHSITAPYRYELSDDMGRAQDVAEELMYRLWDNVEISGGGVLPNGDYAFTLRSKL